MSPARHDPAPRPEHRPELRAPRRNAGGQLRREQAVGHPGLAGEAGPAHRVAIFAASASSPPKYRAGPRTPMAHSPRPQDLDLAGRTPRPRRPRARRPAPPGRSSSGAPGRPAGQHSTSTRSVRRARCSPARILVRPGASPGARPAAVLARSRAATAGVSGGPPMPAAATATAPSGPGSHSHCVRDRRRAPARPPPPPPCGPAAARARRRCRSTPAGRPAAGPAPRPSPPPRAARSRSRRATASSLRRSCADGRSGGRSSTMSQPSSSDATTCGQLPPGSAISSSRPGSRPSVRRRRARPRPARRRSAHHAPAFDAPAASARQSRPQAPVVTTDPRGSPPGQQPAQRREHRQHIRAGKHARTAGCRVRWPAITRNNAATGPHAAACGGSAAGDCAGRARNSCVCRCIPATG